MMLLSTKQRGFTLIELVVTVGMLAAITMIGTSLLVVYSQSQKFSYLEGVADTNRKLGQALQAFAANENNGRLPAPYTGGSYTSAVYDPANAILSGYVADSGVYLDAANNDGFASQRVRVYQVIPLTKDVPFSGSGGDLVELDYDYGVIYQTDCALLDATCNPTASGLPSNSVVLTAANYRTWNVAANDMRPYAFNTYGIQRTWLHETRERVELIRDALRSSFANLLLAGAAGDTTNWHLAPNGAGAPDLSGATAATNQNCHDGWYQLDAANVNILEQLNISPVTTMALTSWGGRIEYCRDYDPAGLGADAQPHGAALRINRSLSDALAPSAVDADNLVIGF